MEFQIEDFENVNINLKDFIDFVMFEKGGRNIIPTGLNALDYMLNGGLRGGDLCFICGRPATGKTAFATQFAGSMAKGDKIVLYFATESCEYTVKEQLALQGFGDANVIVDDNPNTDLTYLRCVITHTKADAVVIDCFENFADNAMDIWEGVAVDLRRLAEKLQLPIICTMQLPRSAYPEPKLSDIPLEIEQEASEVIMLTRDIYYSEDDTPEARIILAKNRYGDTNTFITIFDNDKCIFKAI
jgi:replicative DNA helicase